MTGAPAKPVLLTGASGNLGRMLAKALSAEGWTLRLTDISPFPGASTGCGGEIRDEGATGRGAKPKAGLGGFTLLALETA